MNSSAKVSLPLLSLVMVGRNDDYNPDNLFRLASTLNLAGLNLSRLKMLHHVEIVVVDYKGDTALAKALVLNSAARAITRFIVVPRDGAEPDGEAAATAKPDHFNIPLANNIGVRRARGEFVLVQGLDLLMSHTSWRSLLEVLSGEIEIPFDLRSSIVMIPRRRIPGTFVGRMPTAAIWDRWLKMVSHSAPFMDGHPHLGSGMGGLLAAKPVWQALGGVDERFSNWGHNDVDLTIRASLRGSVIDASAFGIYQFKMVHNPAGRRGKLFKDASYPVNPHWIANTYHANDENWGDGTTEFAEAACANALEFLGSPFSDPMPAWFKADAAIGAAEWQTRLGEEDNMPLVSTAVAPLTTLYTYLLAKLNLVTWYCRNRFPRVVMEVGLDTRPKASQVLNLIALTVPWAEVYMLEHVEQAEVGRLPNVVYAAGPFLPQHAFVGHARALAGNIRSSITALAQTTVGGLKPELTIVDLDSVGPEPLAVFEDVLRVCAGPMFLVVSSTSPDRVAAAGRLLATIRGSQLIVLENGMVALSAVPAPGPRVGA